MVIKLRFTHKLLNKLTAKLIKEDPVPQNCLLNSLRNCYYLHSEMNADGPNMSELLMPYTKFFIKSTVFTQHILLANV